MKKLRITILLLWIIGIFSGAILIDSTLNHIYAAPYDPQQGAVLPGEPGYGEYDPDPKKNSSAAAQKQAEAMSSFIATLMDQTHQIIEKAAKPFHRAAGSIFKICLLIGLFLFGTQAVLSRSGVEDIIKEFMLWMLWVCVCYVAIIKRRWSSHARSHRGSPVGKQHSIFAVKEKRNLRAGAFRARVPHAAHDAA